MTQDLTKITTPFGLLDEATREALIKHGGPYEGWSASMGWGDLRATPCFTALNMVYRVKPEPPKPREWFLVKGRDWYGGEILCAVKHVGEPGVIVCKVKEVLE